MPTKPWSEVKAKLEEDPEFVAAMEELAPYEALARQLIAFRIERDLSQRQLAVLCGTTQSAIARLESGEREPTLATLRKVAHALGGELVLSVREPGRKKARELVAL